jgi:uncharacterized protein
LCIVAEVERSQLKRKLQAGISIHMPAPRRIGKTWTIGRLAQDLRGDGWQVIEVDVEGMSEPEEFARDLCIRIEAQSSLKDRVKAHALQRLTNLIGGNWGDKPLDALGSIDPLDFAETLIASLEASGEKTAIIIDEIAYFFLALAQRDEEAAHRFAYRLRALQQRYRNVRWLITGSIGLDTISRRYGLEGAFVDFDSFALDPFSEEAARSYMRDPVIQQQFNHIFDATDADFSAMFAELGWLAPYYLRMIANEVRPSRTKSDGSLLATHADFDIAFERLLQPNRRSEFAVWREHVEKNLPAVDRDLAKRVLARLSAGTDGEREETLLAGIQSHDASVTRRQLLDILAMLTNDGLIVEAAGRYAFRSGLVRRYWHKYEAD